MKKELEELRSAVRRARGVVRNLKELLDKSKIKTAIEFDFLENQFMFLNGYLTCMDRHKELGSPRHCEGILFPKQSNAI